MARPQQTGATLPDTSAVVHAGAPEVRLDPRSAAVLDRTTRSKPAPPTSEPIAAQVALADEDHAIIDGERD